jgi:hypothetical protein
MLETITLSKKKEKRDYNTKEAATLFLYTQKYARIIM